MGGTQNDLFSDYTRSRDVVVMSPSHPRPIVGSEELHLVTNAADRHGTVIISVVTATTTVVSTGIPPVLCVLI